MLQRETEAEQELTYRADILLCFEDETETNTELNIFPSRSAESLERQGRNEGVESRIVSPSVWVWSRWPHVLVGIVICRPRAIFTTVNGNKSLLVLLVVQAKDIQYFLPTNHQTIHNNVEPFITF